MTTSAPAVRVGPRPAGGRVWLGGVGRVLLCRPGTLRPLQRRSIRVGRIGCGDHHRSRFPRRLPHRAKLIECRGQRELRTAEAGDEVAATHAPGVLHRFEYLIHPRESSRDPFARGGLAGDDAMTCEELLCDCRSPFRGRGVGQCRAIDHRPTALGSGRNEATGAERRGAGTASRARVGRTDQRPQRVQRVIGDLAEPDQIPQRVHRLLWKAFTRSLMNRREERRAVFAQIVEDVRCAAV